MHLKGIVDAGDNLFEILYRILSKLHRDPLE